MAADKSDISEISVPSRGGRRTKTLRTAIAAGAALVLAFAAFATYMTIKTNDDTDYSGAGSGPSVAAAKYDFTKAPDDLCAALDLTPLQTVYESMDDQPVPSRNLSGQVGTASCSITRVHQKGAQLARFVASVNVRADPGGTPMDYQQLIGDTAKVNDDPAPVPGLGDEAVVFAMKDSSKRAGTDLTIVVGVRQSNLVWTLRLSVTRRDGAGWTDAERKDLRERLVNVTRASLPKVTTALA